MRTLRTYAVIFFGLGTATVLLMFTRAFGQYAVSTDYGRFIVEVGLLAIIGGLVLMVCASLKLPVALCAVQTTVTALLTFWADRMRWMYAYCPNCRMPRFARLHLAIVPFRETWSSINAPTFPLNYADGALVGKILYLMAVAVLWYLVGHFYEHRNTRNRRVVAAAITIWGVVLLCLCIALAADLVSRASGFDPLGFLRVSPYGVWALVLILFGVRNLRSFSQMQQTVPS